MKYGEDPLPATGLPATVYANRRLHWLDMDSRDRYRTTGGHPLFGERDIEYCFNRRGYRCPEFEERADLRILAIGCSYVLGVGLPDHVLFHQRFAERFRSAERTVVTWNLGTSAASNDYINRMLQLAVPQLDPHIVLVHFTHGGRREYISVQNTLVTYNPGWTPDGLVDREIKRHFDALSSAYDDRLNLFRNYRGIATLLADRCWLFATIDPWTMEGLMDHIDTERYVGAMEILDLARDEAHPGVKSHAALEQRYWDGFTALRRSAGGFEWEGTTSPSRSPNAEVTP
jgi:hypothetical protein